MYKGKVNKNKQMKIDGVYNYPANARSIKDLTRYRSVKKFAKKSSGMHLEKNRSKNKYAMRKLDKNLGAREKKNSVRRKFFTLYIYKLSL